MKKKIFLFLLFLPLIVAAQCLNDFNLLGGNTASCPGPNYSLTGSEIGADYYLLDIQNGVIHSGPFAGTNDSIEFLYSPSTSVANLAVFATHQSNYAIDFDGIDDNISIASTPSLMPTTAITIEAWVYARSTNGYYEIYRKEDGNDRHLLSFQQGNILAFGIGPAGVYNELDVTINPNDYLNKWVHVAATYDDTAMRLYQNGVQIGIFFVSGALSNMGVSPVKIASNGGVSEFFDGKIDQVRVWNYARSTLDIRNGMNPCYDVGNVGLALDLNMNEGSGDTISDSSANQHIALLQENTTTHSNSDSLYTSSVWQAVSDTISVTTISQVNDIYVDQNASGNNSGHDWQNAYQTITDAMNCATAGDRIHIAQGTYQEGAELLFPFSIDIQGGYSSGGAVLDPTAYPTIIDGQNNHRILRCDPTPSTAVLWLRGITFQNGKASDSDGGAAVLLHSQGLVNQLHITDCIFQNNLHTGTNTVRGGVVTNRLGNTNVWNSSFLNNQVNTSSAVEGGALFTLGNLYIDRSTFRNNNIVNSQSYVLGAAVYADGTNTTIVNSEYSNNSSTSTLPTDGGAIFTTGDTFLHYNTFVNNSCTGNGGAVYQLNNSASALIQTCIFYANTASANNNILTNASTVTISSSYLQNESPLGTNNFNDLAGTIDPMFVDVDNGNYELQPNSLLVDHEDNIGTPPSVDLNGNPRISNCKIDIGAYEYQNFSDTTSANTYYFDKSNVSVNQDGLSWETAFSMIDQISELCLRTKDTIKIANGIYHPSSTIGLLDSCVIMGSYPNGGGEQDVNAYTTVLNGAFLVGQILLRANNFSLTIKGINFRKLQPNYASIIARRLNLYDVSIEDCSPSLGTSFIVFIETNGSLVANNCLFRFNYLGGRIIHLSGPSSVANLQNCVFKSNSFSSIHSSLLFTDNLILTDCQFTNNYAPSIGLIQANTFQVQNCVFEYNQLNSDVQGGGSVIEGELGEISNSLFYRNTSSDGQGVLSITKKLSLTNCTFYNNRPQNQKGVILLFPLVDSLSAVNCAFVDNATSTSPNHIETLNPGTVITTQHSYFSGEYRPGLGNLNDSLGLINPLFVDTANNDFRLLPNSPLINMGASNDAITDTDLDGQQRIQSCAVDIGAYEHPDSTWGVQIADTSFCQALAPTHLVTIGDNISWYSDTALSNLLAAGNLPIYTSVGSYTYYAADSSFNCPKQIADSVVVEVLPDLEPDLGTDTVFCSGESIVLDPGTYDNYLWNTNSNFSSLSIDTSGQFIVEVSMLGGCTGSDTIVVSELALPNIDLGLDQSFCSGDSVLLDAGSGYSYLWNTSATSQTIYAGQGTYFVSLTDANNCSKSDTIELMALDLPDVSATISTNTITANNESIGATYSWLDCDNNFAIIADENNLSFTALSSGNYALAINENGCVDTSSCYSIMLSTTLDNLLSENIHLYPNPTSGDLFIGLETISEKLNISLLSTKGQLIEEYQFEPLSTLKIELTLPSGLYFLKVSNEHNQQAIFKVIKN